MYTKCLGSLHVILDYLSIILDRLCDFMDFITFWYTPGEQGRATGVLTPPVSLYYELGAA
jgi:hypothetical protein